MPGDRRPMTTVELLELDRKERMLREAREKGLRDYISSLDYAREQGRLEGLAEVAKNMLAMGMDLELIVQATGLAREKVEELKNQTE